MRNTKSSFARYSIKNIIVNNDRIIMMKINIALDLLNIKVLKNTSKIKINLNFNIVTEETCFLPLM